MEITCVKHLETRKIYPMIFLGLLGIFIPSCKESEAKTALKIGMIDTLICKSNFPSIIFKKNIKIYEQLQTPTQIDSLRMCKTKSLNKAIFHGHKVLLKLLRHLDKKIPPTLQIEIYPVNIFDQNTQQSFKNWQKALAYLGEKKIHMLMLATGYIQKLGSPKKFNLERYFQNQRPFIISAAGNIGRGLTHKAKIWPSSYQHPQMLLIGNYLKPPKNFPLDIINNKISKLVKEKAYKVLTDYRLLNSKKIHYFFEEPTRPQQGIGGSSGAVALAVSSMIISCSQEIQLRNFKNF